jgi:hypothetical protein
MRIMILSKNKKKLYCRLDTFGRSEPSVSAANRLEEIDFLYLQNQKIEFELKTRYLSTAKHVLEPVSGTPHSVELHRTRGFGAVMF